MDDIKTPARPLCLELEDAKKEIFGAIKRVADNRHLPWFLLDYIVTDAAKQVAENARQERETAKAMYEKQLEELKKDQ